MKRFGPLAMALTILAGCSGTPRCEDDIAAFVMANGFVEKTLKAPATADFASYTDPGVGVTRSTGANGTCEFTVRTFVDAENSFGAKLRNNFIVRVTPDPADENSWLLREISPL